MKISQRIEKVEKSLSIKGDEPVTIEFGEGHVCTMRPSRLAQIIREIQETRDGLPSEEGDASS